jgi:hypothetical protein
MHLITSASTGLGFLPRCVSRIKQSCMCSVADNVHVTALPAAGEVHPEAQQPPGRGLEAVRCGIETAALLAASRSDSIMQRQRKPVLDCCMCKTPDHQQLQFDKKRALKCVDQCMLSSVKRLLQGCRCLGLDIVLGMSGLCCPCAAAGGCAELGHWTPEVSPSLQWQEGGIWSAEVALPPGEYSFKCMLRRADGSYVWEAGENRHLAVRRALAPGQDSCSRPAHSVGSTSTACMWIDEESAEPFQQHSLIGLLVHAAWCSLLQCT